MEGNEEQVTTADNQVRHTRGQGEKWLFFKIKQEMTGQKKDHDNTNLIAV